ncbi:phospholipase D-like protein [Roseivirga pacifica]|uniref:phospholipase D n=1 Tax=Roseivirga pacifica TaxID=1267423 RepID=A0A1I0QHQ3_9BACT|nr:phospholipase D-like domain-containing protein [Roseivirga pacifica]RKQ42910.1 phospholipase D-like protein [Roseivirga pacifica]SEW26525.1 PLD-like domain-containing protein [Roseivirga pacifica]
MIKTYFTKQTDVKSLILKELNTANNRVVIAVAWFTEVELFQKLLTLQKRGVDVEVIITKHQFNEQSKNHYETINENGGYFAEVGSDDQLMHMKFCIIDSRIVISGSANWTNRAFTENNEEVTFVEGYGERVLSFEEEFLRLKKVAGYVHETSPFALNTTIKKLNIIKALIQGEDYSLINQYILQIQDFAETQKITDFLKAGDYYQASIEIDTFIKTNSQVFNLSEIEKQQLNSEIRLLTAQIESIELQKLEAETLIDQWNHYFVIELNPLIIEVVKYKKKVYEKYAKRGKNDTTFHDLEKELNDAQSEFKEEKAKNYEHLNVEDQNSLKETFREAVKLCHWDLPKAKEIFESEEEANRVFNSLHEAYSRKNKAKVEEILSDLKAGALKSNYIQESELVMLRAKKQHLILKYENTIQELSEVLSSDVYKLLSALDDWSKYFEEQKKALEIELTEIKQKYYHYV